MENFNKIEVFLGMCRESQRESVAAQIPSSSKFIMFGSNLYVSDRILHYLIDYVFLPKYSNHSRINELELQALYAIKKDLPVNWALTIMHHMEHQRRLTGG